MVNDANITFLAVKKALTFLLRKRICFASSIVAKIVSRFFPPPIMLEQDRGCFACFFLRPSKQCNANLNL